MAPGAAVTYAVAIAALGAALLLRYVLSRWIGTALPFITIFGAVAAAVWVGGYRPGFVVAVLGYAGCLLLFRSGGSGRYPFDVLGGVAGLLAYIFTSAVIVAFVESTRAAHARASREREQLHVTLRSIGDGVITADVDGRITSLNAVAEKLTGWTAAEAVGEPLPAVFHIINEETREPVENPVLRALREGITLGLANHTVLIQKGGGECAIDDTAAPIRNARGQVEGAVLVFRDITEQRRMEREKANQFLTARLLAAIIESSDDAIIGKSLDGVIQTWNAGAERIFGYTAAEAVGRPISLVIPPDRISEEEEIIARLKAGKRVEHFETERVRADGRRIRVSLTISPIRDKDGRVVGASKVARDVTDQRAAEERERELLAEAAAANAKFHAFFEQGALFAGIMDVNGTLLDANRLSLEGCGYTREQVIGRPFWDGPWWTPSPDLVDQIKAASARAAAGEAFRAEMPYFVANGIERLAEVSILPIKDDTGRVLFLAPTGVDITERKRAEADREKFARDLSDADRRKNEFLAMLAHELRNPLAPISNAARVLRLSNGNDPEALRAASETLDRQVTQMGRLVDDLLDMSRITRGRIELRRERIELAPVVHQAVEAVRALYKSLNHELSVRLPSDPVYLDADPARLAQVIANLLNNACKFTDRGGHVVLSAEREGDEAVIRVRDSGIGIAAEHLPRVFDMFAQVDTSLERSRDGLGIGLTLVRSLVELHGGTVRAHSEGLGKGSEFTVRLPALSYAAAPVTRPEAPEAPKPPAAGRRVLIVDDNEDGAESLAMLLEFGGHQTYKARDGVEAIAAAERLRPDAVLLDIGLPRLNGYEACSRIREQPWGKGLLIVALTGWGQEEDRQRSKDAGFDVHMVKPVDYDALMELLASPASVREPKPETTHG